MACRPVRKPDGTVAGFACHRGLVWKPAKRGYCKPCLDEGARVPATKRCDGPRPGQTGKTCDVWLCDKHAHGEWPNVDYCPACYQRLFGAR